MDPFPGLWRPFRFVGGLVGVALGIRRRSTFYFSGPFPFFPFGDPARVFYFFLQRVRSVVTGCTAAVLAELAGEQGEGAACGHRLSRGGVVAQVRVERTDGIYGDQCVLRNGR